MCIHNWRREVSVFCIALLLPSLAKAEELVLAPRPSMQNAISPLVEKYCIDCHSGGEAEAGLSFEPLLESQEVNQHRKAWQKVLKQLRDGTMPPEDADVPTDQERSAASEWIEAELNSFDCSDPQRPGHVTLRRLNRVEYRNTIRDLLGVEFDPTETFPRDTLGYGYDNIGDVLSLSPLLVEKYLDAAGGIAAEAAIAVEAPTEKVWRNSLAWRGEVVHWTAYFLSRAYRRPATTEEVERAMQLVEQSHNAGGSFQQAIRLVVQLALASPSFLFRSEAPPTEDAHLADENVTADSYPLDDYQLATRLSYFLWSTMPDEELFRQAAAGTLHENLDAQVNRMLASERSDQFVRNFGEQWLETRRLQTIEPNSKLFPDYDDSLAAALGEETFLLLRNVFREDLPIATLLEADYSFLNERLAEHYSVEGVAGENFRRVELPEVRQAGLLAHGSVLAVTSHSDRTSPVLRGKWIMQHLLNDAPPPPPMAIDLSEDLQVTEGKSLRERLEVHRASSSCSVCHQVMDQLGFALENFDPLGRWRDEDGEFPVDSSGRLPDGREFSGPQGLRDILLGDLDAFRKCLVEQVLTYALGRGLEYYDQCALEQIALASREQGDTLSGIVRAVVQSVPFQYAERPHAAPEETESQNDPHSGSPTPN